MSNKQAPSLQDVSLAISQLMPNIIRGIQLDFFVKKGVTQTQFLVLTAIRAYGRCTMGVLARNLHIRMPTATGIIDRLVQRGYVRRLAMADDRRQVAVELTPAGTQFIQQFQTIARRRWEEVMSTLQVGELQAFHRIITKLQTQVRPDR